MTALDEPVKMREGEELDAGMLRLFLLDSIPGLDGDISIRQFPGGFSNLTYFISVGGREMVLRRPPFGKKAKTAHDMSREYRVLSALKPYFPYCPEPLVYCEDMSVIDSAFYVMERIKGIILRKDLPEDIRLNTSGARTLSANLIGVLAELHSVDYIKAGLNDFGKPEGYIRRQVEGWSGRYRDARTSDAPDYEKVMEWLIEKIQPDTSAPCLIHNDFKFDNAVLDPADPLKIIGILDWEMATAGDPFMDLGSSLAYWVEKDDPPAMQLIRMMPTNIEGMLTRKEQVDLYSKLTGRAVEAFDFYYTFGLFRLAVIAQQIYYRFFNGQTKDKRFGMLIHAVRILEGAALEVMKKSEL